MEDDALKEYIQDVDDFLIIFFAQTKKIIDFENSKIKEYELIEPNIDYTRVRRFLISAINNLKSIDNKLVNGLLLKLYKDEESLYEAYVDYQSRNRITSIIFERYFLSNISTYIDINNKLKLAKSKEDEAEKLSKTLDHKLIKLKIDKQDNPTKDNDLDQEIKITNKRLADAYSNRDKYRKQATQLTQELNYFKETIWSIFKEKYEKTKEYYFKQWRKIINIKCYYLDKLLWFEASKSTMVQKFFLNADISGNYDIKTFIQYYLKNIDSQKSKNPEWHNYLHSVLQVL